MRKEQKEIIKLTSEKFLIDFFDIVVSPFFAASSIYKQPIAKLKSQDKFDKTEINNRIQYLKRMKYICLFSEGKEKYLELLPKGKDRVNQHVLENLSISKPVKWDKKWRIVIFDIPEEDRHSRDILRQRLVEMGFLQIQKSVYVFPFSCTDEITYISSRLGIIRHVIIMIAEIIQGEDEIINRFIGRKTLDKTDLIQPSK